MKCEVKVSLNFEAAKCEQSLPSPPTHIHTPKRSRSIMEVCFFIVLPLGRGGSASVQGERFNAVLPRNSVKLEIRLISCSVLIYSSLAL